MPELPDLTVFAENLDKQVTKKRITVVDCQRKVRLNITPENLRQSLLSEQIDTVERSGKEILFLMGSGAHLYVHLMLTGGFVLTATPEKVPYPQLTLGFEDGMHLVVSDVKAMVAIALDPERPAIAPDALMVPVAELKRLISRFSKARAKAFLIDQKVMRGIGNAYADEILWEARISPKSVMGKLPEHVVETLGQKIPQVLERAVVAIKETNPGIIAGEIRDFLLIHNPARRMSPTGHPIIKETISSKTTYFTQEQELYL